MSRLLEPYREAVRNGYWKKAYDLFRQDGLPEVLGPLEISALWIGLIESTCFPEADYLRNNYRGLFDINRRVLQN